MKIKVKTTTKTISVLLLALCMALTCAPLPSFTATPTVKEIGDFTVQINSGDANLQHYGNDRIAALATGGNYVVSMKSSETPTADCIRFVGSAENGTTYLTIKDLNINDTSGAPAIFIPRNYKGDIVICISGSNILQAQIEKSNEAGVSSGRLIITDNGDRTASLTVSSNLGAAAIGGDLGYSGENIIINANVTAVGTSRAAGIGGGDSGSGTVTINGGTVTADAYYDNDLYISEYGGAGIGGGRNGVGNITINGGFVTVRQDDESRYDIGNGDGCYDTGTLTINGGSIFARTYGMMNPLSENGDALSNYTMSLRDAPGGNALADAVVAYLPDYSAYNLSGVTTDKNGVLSLWLPVSAAARVKSVRLPNGAYCMSESGFSGTKSAYFDQMSGLPIEIEVIGGPEGVRGVVFDRTGYPYSYDPATGEYIDTLAELGEVGMRYAFMIDSTSLAPTKPLADGYTLVGLYLNDGYPDGTEHIISSDFSLGSFYDGENGNLIVLTNSGNTEVTVSLIYTAAEGFEAVAGTFTDGENTLGATVPLSPNETVNARLTLSGKPQQPENESESILTGTIKIAIISNKNGPVQAGGGNVE